MWINIACFWLRNRIGSLYNNYKKLRGLQNCFRKESVNKSYVYIASVLTRALQRIIIRNQFQGFQLNVNSPHISSNINALYEPSNFTNDRDLQLAKLVHTELSDDWLLVTSKWR